MELFKSKSESTGRGCMAVDPHAKGRHENPVKTDSHACGHNGLNQEAVVLMKHLEKVGSWLNCP